MTTTYRLKEAGGQLWFPSGGYPTEKDESLLIRRYPAGDCDVCPWPIKSEAERIRLAHALYDERETNSTWTVRDTVIIELPNGTPFDFDELVS